MIGSRLEAELSRWSESIDGLAVDDEALRVFANLLCVYLGRGPEDQEGIASMASIVVDPEADDDEVQAALDTLRESLHSRVAAADLEAQDDLSDAEREVSRRMDAEEATFADRLRVVMAEKGMSQVQLAEAVGVGQPAISMMLARECRPQRRTVEKLALALNVAPEELWPGFARQIEATENLAPNPGDGADSFAGVDGMTFTVSFVKEDGTFTPLEADDRPIQSSPATPRSQVAA